MRTRTTRHEVRARTRPVASALVALSMAALAACGASTPTADPAPASVASTTVAPSAGSTAAPGTTSTTSSTTTSTVATTTSTSTTTTTVVTTTGPPFTVVTVPETTSLSGTYTPELHAAFVDECVKGSGQTSSTTLAVTRRSFCECVFAGIIERIPYQEYLDITDQVANGTSILKTKVGPIIQECAAKYPGAGGT